MNHEIRFAPGFLIGGLVLLCFAAPVRAQVPDAEGHCVEIVCPDGRRISCSSSCSGSSSSSGRGWRHSGPSAAELAADVAESAAAFAAEAAGLPAGAWTAQVRLLRGPALPVRRVPAIRLFEVEVHHVDLGTGYRPDDWPDGFAADNLPRVARDFAGREDTPARRLQPDGGDSWLHIGPGEPATAAATVHGTPAGLLAWLLGRDDGKGLRVSGDDATLPELPVWR